MSLQQYNISRLLFPIFLQHSLSSRPSSSFLFITFSLLYHFLPIIFFLPLYHFLILFLLLFFTQTRNNQKNIAITLMSWRKRQKMWERNLVGREYERTIFSSHLSNHFLLCSMNFGVAIICRYLIFGKFGIKDRATNLTTKFKLQIQIIDSSYKSQNFLSRQTKTFILISLSNSNYL